MFGSDPVIFRELPVIQKIIDDETWLEGERRRCYVSPFDSVVQERVCAIVLEIGSDLRASIVRSLARRAPGPPDETSGEPSDSAAA
jgi:hypothetical protein